MPPSVAPASAVGTIEPDESLIAAFEGALRTGPPPALADFVPPKLMPNRLPTLVELVRSDLEWRWDRGMPKPADAYLAEYPELANASGAVAALAFEEYRARLRLGEPARPEEYRARFQVPTDSWPAADAPVTVRRSTQGPIGAADGTVRQPVEPVEGADQLDEWVKTLPGATAWPLCELKESKPAAVAAWRTGVTELPEVGAEFQGFKLVEELGRGAFGRVFLARQGDLAGRPVALKIGTGLFPRVADARPAPAHQHRPHLFAPPVAEPAGGLHAVLRADDARPRAEGAPAATRRCRRSGDALLSTVQQHASATRTESRFGGPGVAPSAPGLSPAAEPAAWGLVKRLSYPNAVAWVGAQLAAGLAHAHGRGILHRDLKPANVLLTDDGVPMLLDFNLAEDTKVQNQFGGAAVGGTLPYMAPEQMAAFVRLDGAPDARSDVYSLGVMLYELLTGRRPFPEPEKGPLREVVDKLVDGPAGATVGPGGEPGRPAGRGRGGPQVPGLRPGGPVPVGRRPAGRPGAAPGRPAAPACPRAARPGAGPQVGGPAPAALLVGDRRDRGRHPPRRRGRGRVLRPRAVAGLRGPGGRSATTRPSCGPCRRPWTTATARPAGRTRPSSGCRAVLDRYGISPDDPDDGWERGKLVRYLFDRRPRGPAGGRRRGVLPDGPVGRPPGPARGRPGRAGRTAPPGRAVERGGRAVRRRPAAAGRRSPSGPTWPGCAVTWPRSRGRARRCHAAGDGPRPLPARRLVRPARPAPRRPCRPCGRRPRWTRRTCPPGSSAGRAIWPSSSRRLAALCFGSCVAVDKDFAPAWLNRGLAYARLRFFDQACDDYDRAVRLDPTMTEALVQRAMAKEGRRDLPGAIADLTAALAAGGAPTRVYFIRARLRDEAGDAAGAAADRPRGCGRRRRTS